jgi:uncharacterized membrane protein YfcA
MMLIFLFCIGLVAGVQNALAGGGSFLVLPALMAAGLDARAANITSTLALWPGQLATGAAGWRQAQGIGPVRLGLLSAISLAGGGAGALLLLATPAPAFGKLLPFLVLVATLIFVWGSFFRKSADHHGGGLSPLQICVVQAAVAIYGGYFGGGIGFLMMAVFTVAGLGVREAGATKNLLAGILNTMAVVIFAFSPAVNWLFAASLGGGAILGGQAGARLLARINPHHLRVAICGLGFALTIGLFVRAGFF